MVSKEIKNPVIKTFEQSSLGVGSSWSEEWDSDDNYIIRHILIKADGAATTKSTITVRVNNVAITKDKALCNTFGSSAENALLLNIDLDKDVKFDFELINNEGATKDFTLELVLEKKE